MRTKKQQTVKEQMRKHDEKCRRFMPIEEFRSLTFGMKIEQIAELSGYSCSTVRRWFTEKMPVLLYHPTWRRGFTGRELAGMWYEIQTKAWLESEVRNLKNSIEKLSDKIDKQESLIFFYRSQVTAEAKLGMCMTRIMA